MRREVAQLLAEEEPIPDVWAEVAGVVRGELARRDRVRSDPRVNPLALSWHARAVLVLLATSDGVLMGSGEEGGEVPAALQAHEVDFFVAGTELYLFGWVEQVLVADDGEWPPTFSGVGLLRPVDVAALERSLREP